MSKNTSFETNEKQRETLRRARLLTIPDINVAAMGITDLLEEKAELDKEIQIIDAQLKEARAKVFTSGEYADPEWYRRAEYAKKIKGRFSQEIQLRIRKLKEEKKLKNANVGDELGLTTQDWDGFYKVMRVLRQKANDVKPEEPQGG